MVAFSTIALGLTAIAGAFAAPAAEPVADLPDFELTTKDLVRRQDYSQNYKTSGNINFSPTSNGYSVDFSNAGDFVVGKGWNKGTNRYEDVTFSAHFPFLTRRTGRLLSAAQPVPPPGPFLFPCTVGPPVL